MRANCIKTFDLLHQMSPLFTPKPVLMPLFQPTFMAHNSDPVVEKGQGIKVSLAYRKTNRFPGKIRFQRKKHGFRILDEIHVSYLPVNIGLRIPFPTAVDSVLGTALRLLGLKSWGLTRIIKARK